MAGINILFASSEVEPFMKTGGLADVAGSLPKALAKLNNDVRVVMPKYKHIPQSYVEQMEYVGYIYVDLCWKHEYCGILKLKQDGVVYYFLDCEDYFGRDGIYGYNDDGERFTFFSKAILQILELIKFKPDIIHCNDWQTAIIPTLLDAHYKSNGMYYDMKTVFTIHNMKYQGVFPKEIMDGLLNLDWKYFTEDKIEFFDQVNFLKAGLVYADAITTVSKTYAEEIHYDFFGESLTGTVQKRTKDLYGILNGIDEKANDPANDKRIFENFTAENLEGKMANKALLQESLGLNVRSDIPVVGIISRLVDQKGFDLIAHVMEDIMHLDIQMIVLGAGDRKYEDMLQWFHNKYPDKLSVNLKYDPILSQRIYAGSDIFLMPSLFEPCGLSQMFSFRYGTIPVVRETGGLKDTVMQYNETTGEGNGFTFSRYNAHDMLYALRQAVSCYYQKATWNKLMVRGMGLDFSWEKSAKEYLEVYKKILGKKK